MILTKTLLVKWNGSQRKYYESKGYVFTKFNDEFECKFEDIPHASDKFVDCQCDYCGKIYSVQIKKHYRNTQIIQKDACKDCAGIKNKEVKLFKYGRAGLISESSRKKYYQRVNPMRIQNYNCAIDLFKKKGYLMMPTIYVGNDTKLPYICPEHSDKGIQWITYSHLKNGRGCRYCGMKNAHASMRYTYDEVKDFIECNGKNKLLSSTYTGYNDYNLNVTCEVCGNVYRTSLGFFLKGQTLCKECTCSNGERQILTYLKNKNIDYIKEHEFCTCYWDNPLRFDFYLPEYNIAIEFDGEQHYKPIRFSGESQEEANDNFINTQLRDEAKNKHCKDNSIILWRIPYWYRNELNETLDYLFANYNHQTCFL